MGPGAGVSMICDQLLPSILCEQVYGIPSSTLYKIARKEKIELAQPFNAVQTTWTQAG